MAGGRGIQTPFGIFYGSNITPHPEAGIGRWSDEDFVRAMTLGGSSGWKPLFPGFSLHFLQIDDRNGSASSQRLPLQSSCQPES
ncbi:MAG: hypothetical protein VXX42_07905, partial [SAR324 cluster bacterium]|nr:hypothetical protein [SAR324 cluster bacterium]